MTSPLYPIFRKRIDDAVAVLLEKQVDPWAMLNSGKPMRVKTFTGKQISYEGVGFEGSPETVFWSRYIGPFLEDLCVREITEAVKMAKDSNVDARVALPEIGTLLVAGCHRIYNRMRDIDRRLRGRGYPKQVPERKIDKESGEMRAFVDERINAELALIESAQRARVGQRKGIAALLTEYKTVLTVAAAAVLRGCT